MLYTYIEEIQTYRGYLTASKRIEDILRPPKEKLTLTRLSHLEPIIMYLPMVRIACIVNTGHIRKIWEGGTEIEENIVGATNKREESKGLMGWMV